MQLIKWLTILFSKIFTRQEKSVSEKEIKSVKIAPNKATLQQNKPNSETSKDQLHEGSDAIQKNIYSPIIPKEIFQSWKIDFNEYKPFLPNWGDLDPTISTISNGRERIDFINFLYDEFVSRYGKLTTDLGYGLIYSIVMNAIEEDDRSVSSALREAIARSNDPLLCVAVVKDYCHRKAIQFDQYEKITIDILKRREAYYNSKTKSENNKSSIDFTTLPALSYDEQQELSKSLWLFNGTLMEIYPKPETKKPPLYLMVKIPTLRDSQIVRKFNRDRYWKLNQNLVIQRDGEADFRVLDFK